MQATQVTEKPLPDVEWLQLDGPLLRAMTMKRVVDAV
jgi:hypothetical protein